MHALGKCGDFAESMLQLHHKIFYNITMLHEFWLLPLGDWKLNSVFEMPYNISNVFGDTNVFKTHNYQWNNAVILCSFSIVGSIGMQWVMIQELISGLSAWPL